MLEIDPPLTRIGYVSNESWRLGLKSYYEKYILITINSSVWRNEPKLNQHVSWAESMSI
jgi:hypothetical protein